MKKISFKIESKTTLVDLLSKAVKAACSMEFLSEVDLYNIELSITESVMNVIKHAYHMDPEQIIELTTIIEGEYITFELQDSGDFKPLSDPKDKEIYTKQSINRLPESGMGLMIIRQVMEQVELDRKEGKNHLMMRMRKAQVNYA